jgi:ribosome maturation factor RimP
MVELKLQDTENYLVSVLVRSGNRIHIFIDNDNDVRVVDCIKLSKGIEGMLDRDSEDFELLVSSAGLDQPFILPRQYQKYINRKVDVELIDGKKIKAILTDVGEEYIKIKNLIKKGKSKKLEEGPEQELPFSEIKETKPGIHFG